MFGLGLTELIVFIDSRPRRFWSGENCLKLAKALGKGINEFRRAARGLGRR